MNLPPLTGGSFGAGPGTGGQLNLGPPLTGGSFGGGPGTGGQINLGPRPVPITPAPVRRPGYTSFGRGRGTGGTMNLW